MRLLIAGAIVFLAVLNGRLDAGDTGFTLKTGDRVVLLGGGFIEQERQYSRLETLLVSRHPNADLVFRNLGWGGDTVRGGARTGGYQNPEGLARLLKEVQDLKPTVLFLGYGMNESFDGPRGLAAFIEGYEQLLTKLAPLKARIVLLSPTYHEDLGRPLPDPVNHNRNLEEYTAALQKFAQSHNLAFVDLFHPLRAAKHQDSTRRLTTNGILLTDLGYALIARAVNQQLHLQRRIWRVELDCSGKILASKGTAIATPTAVDGTLHFTVQDTTLPLAKVGSVAGDVQFLRVAGLPAGVYALAIDGQEVVKAAAADWQKGLNFSAEPAYGDAEKLRAAIVRNNELFYRRWRPFNDHSRHWDFMKGDFGLYDKEIAEQERVIAQARRPRPHTYVIAPKGGMK
jgi:lysophospholipase L1-like esterase